jgi:hypothetical protein
MTLGFLDIVVEDIQQHRRRGPWGGVCDRRQQSPHIDQIRHGILLVKTPMILGNVPSF